MKKVILVLVFSLMVLNSSALAQYLPIGASIGVVDIMTIVAGYDKAVKIDADLKSKETGFEQVYKEKLGVLQSAVEEGKAEDELMSLKEKLESELKPQYDKLLQESDKVSAEILKEIIEATQVVAKNKGIGVVRREVVLAGGIDITDDVIKHLNESLKKSWSKGK